jgi:hypothetical protein
MKNGVQIVCNATTARLRYTLQEVFEKRLGLPYSIILPNEAYDASVPTLFYLNSSIISESNHWFCDGLLFEETINAQFDYPNIDISKIDFKTVDILAIVFAYLSRYVEYNYYSKTNATLFLDEPINNFEKTHIKEPVVEIIVAQIKNYLHQQFTSLEFKLPQFKKILTADIDIAFKYKGRNVLRQIGAMLKDPKSLGRRWAVLQNKITDPFETFEKLYSLQPQYSETILFFPAGANAKKDRHIPVTNKHLKQVIKQIPNTIQIGLHPTLNSNSNEIIIATEKNILSEISNRTINYSRQHYLAFKLPTTYNALLKAGLQKDFSMGYNNLNGFRAGTCLPFAWFNLATNEATSLLIQPLICMDAVYIYNNNYTVATAITDTQLLINACRRYNGNFCIDVHNNHLTHSHAYLDWFNAILY